MVQVREQQPTKTQPMGDPKVLSAIDNSLTTGASGGHHGPIFPQIGTISPETGMIKPQISTVKLDQSLLGVQGELTSTKDDGSRPSDPKTQTVTTAVSDEKFPTAILTTHYTPRPPNGDDIGKWDPGR